MRDGREMAEELESLVGDKDKRIAELEAALCSVAHQCGNVIFNCEQRPADNERHLLTWRSVRDFVTRELD